MLKEGLTVAYGDNYLAPSELDPFEPDAKGFFFDELTKMIDKSDSQRIVTILDCCYSGAARIGKGSEEDAANAGRKAIDEKTRILERGEGKCILAASQAYQKAFETAQKNHSLFSYYLIEGLKGNEETVDNYGYVTPDSLGRYVYNKIMSLPPEERPMQKPIRKVQQSGDIVLAYYPQFLKTKHEDAQLKEKSEALIPRDNFTSQRNKLDEKTLGDFSNRVTTLEMYIKGHKDFNFASCARDLGLSINEVRTIISYIFENKFKCSNCGHRFKTKLALKTHNETHH